MSAFPGNALRARKLRTAAQLETYSARAARAPWHIVRHDGVLLGGYASHERAVRACAVMAQGQVHDFAHVARRGAR